jgi:hypothetical protein
LCLDLISCELFEDSCKSVAGVIDYDIDSAELVDGCFERSVDLFLVGDIELEGKVVLRDR